MPISMTYENPRYWIKLCMTLGVRAGGAGVVIPLPGFGGVEVEPSRWRGT